MQLACVIHRFGADIAGGSESHCRAIAERLSRHHEVTVLTTCAKDYLTWRNEYAAGASRSGSVRVVRFPVARQRHLHRFREISELVFSGRASLAEQEQWFRENGPDAPELLTYLQQHGAEYDRVIFWSYRYAPSFFGVPLVADRAILVPTAEDDPLIHARILARFFALPAGYWFLTPEEADLVRRRSAQPLLPAEIIGTGLEPASAAADPSRLDALGIVRPYVLYLGRIERNKGCETLLRHFLRYVAAGSSPAPLVMAGPANMPIPEHPLIKPLGFVDDVLRETLLAQAAALIVPSPFESLSLVLLEAWNHGVPALVNGHCSVLKGQVRRADGGLYYRHAEEFSAGLSYLLDHPHVATQLGRQGLAYVEREYRWPTVMRRIEEFLSAPTAASSSSASRSARTSRFPH